MNTGTKPFCRIGATVVGKPAAHGDDFVAGPQRRFAEARAGQRGQRRARLAEEPELHEHAGFDAEKRRQFVFEGLAFRPSVSQKSSVAETAASTSSSVNTRPA